MAVDIMPCWHLRCKLSCRFCMQCQSRHCTLVCFVLESTKKALLIKIKVLYQPRLIAMSVLLLGSESKLSGAIAHTTRTASWFQYRQLTRGRSGESLQILFQQHKRQQQVHLLVTARHRRQRQHIRPRIPL